MAENYEAPALLIVALLLIAAATPTAYGQGQGALRANILGIVNIDIDGRLSVNAPTAPIPNATVSLNCTTGLGGPSITMARNMTDVNGIFNIRVNKRGPLTSLPSACGLFVDDVPLVNQTVSLTLNTVNATLTRLGLGGVRLTLSVPLNIRVGTTV